MEHLLILFIEGLVRLDHAARKPLDKAIPDLQRLLAHPERVLAEQPVRIGPWKRRGTVLLVTLCLTFLIYLVSCIGLLEYAQGRPGPPAKQPNPEPRILPTLGVVVSLLVVGSIPVGLYALLGRFLAGGTMLLRVDGVELAYRGTAVFCPWKCFRRPGQARRGKRGWALLPIDPVVVSDVVCTRSGNIADAGFDVRTPQLKFVSDAEVALRDLYEVEIVSCGQLLLSLGHALGR